MIRLLESHRMPLPLITQSRRLYSLTLNRNSYTASLTSSILDYQYASLLHYCKTKLNSRSDGMPGTRMVEDTTLIVQGNMSW
jgi:hypothetical protein